jgi:hypothetical protein
MAAAAEPPTRCRILLEQVSRADPGPVDRPPASDRLEQAIGAELAARLVAALAGDHGVRRVL